MNLTGDIVRVARITARQQDIHKRAAAAVAVREPASVVRQRQPVDGAQVLGYAEKLLGRFASWPRPEALDAAVLWAAHCHARDASKTLVFDATARLMFLSSEPGSGKSRALELTGMLCPYVFGLDTEPTEAGLVYTIAQEHATVLLDEADVLFGAGKRKAALRAVLNSGYTRSGTVLRMRGGKGERAKVFGPIALAGLDVVETATGEALAPLFTRSIRIRMRKSAEPVPQLDRQARGMAEMIRGALAAWANDIRGELTGARPDVPDWLMNRAEEIWTPLLAIADAAGGDWPDRARAACKVAVLTGSLSAGEDQDVMAGIEAGMSGWEV